MKPLFAGGKTAGASTQTIDAPSATVLSNVIQENPIANLPARIPATPVTNFRVITDDDIDKLGAQNAGRARGMNEKILSAVKASDTDQFGTQLNQLVATAKSLDPNKMAKPGLIGKITGMFGSAKEKLMGELQTVEKRIDVLTAEMDKSVKLYTSRIGDIEKMFEENYQTHERFAAEVKVAEEMLVHLEAALAAEGAATDAFGAQRQADLQNRIHRLEKKTDDLRRGMHLCKMAAPELRLMQDNSRALAQTFNDIKMVTIPAYMSVFSRYILNLEAKKGAELATNTMNATDEAFRMQADQLRQNTQVIAQAKQRSVVSIETIEHMQAQLMASFDDAAKIAEAGRAARLAAAPKLVQLEQELVTRFAGGQKQQLSLN